MASVVCVGLAVQDLVFTVDEPVLTGEKNFASSLQAIGGGPAANAAVAIACLGGSASLVTALGTDAIGDEVVSDLAARGVDVSAIRRVDAPSPLSAVVIGHDGDRTIFNRTDPALWDLASPPDATDVDGAAAVLVDVRWPTGATAAAKHARASGIPVVVDVDLTDTTIPRDLIEAATHLVYAQPAFERETGRVTEAAVRSAAGETGSFVAVTMGAEGVLWSEDGSRVDHEPATPIAAVDTLGAGDVFHGAFALALATGSTPRDIVRWSSVATAVKCTRGGGRDGFPREVDLAPYLEEA